MLMFTFNSSSCAAISLSFSANFSLYAVSNSDFSFAFSLLKLLFTLCQSLTCICHTIDSSFKTVNLGAKHTYYLKINQNYLAMSLIQYYLSLQSINFCVKLAF